MITFKNTSVTPNTQITVTPSSMKWSLQDVSAADSGRDVTGYMYKNRVAQKVKLEFEFNGLTWSQVSTLLQIIDAEYFSVTYPDMKTGTVLTKTFYCGDRECPVWTWWDGQKIISTTSFNVIER